MRQNTRTLTLVTGLLLASAAHAAGPIGTLDPLTFFDEAVPETLYRFEADITIDEHSLETGLVSTNTCHFNLDPIDRVEIVFARERLHDLEIVSHQGIGSVTRDDHLVSLRDVTRGAGICISVRTRSLESDDEGYVLKGGPLQRRFLDSLHPMSMRGTVHLGTDKLVYRAMEPANQPGWLVELKPGRIDYGGYFAGVLRTEIRFDQIRALAAAPLIIADSAAEGR